MDPMRFYRMNRQLDEDEDARSLDGRLRYGDLYGPAESIDSRLADEYYQDATRLAGPQDDYLPNPYQGMGGYESEPEPPIYAGPYEDDLLADAPPITGHDSGIADVSPFPPDRPVDRRRRVVRYETSPKMTPSLWQRLMNESCQHLGLSGIEPIDIGATMPTQQDAFQHTPPTDAYEPEQYLTDISEFDKSAPELLSPFFKRQSAEPASPFDSFEREFDLFQQYVDGFMMP